MRTNTLYTNFSLYKLKTQQMVNKLDFFFEFERLPDITSTKRGFQQLGSSLAFYFDNLSD